MADNRAIVYVEDGMPIYRASSVGLPLRCLTAARAGNQPLEAPEYLRRAAEEGNRYEVTVKDRLRADGWIIEDEQETIEVPIEQSGEEVALIRGHLDGFDIYRNDSAHYMLEVKSMSENVFDKWTRHRFDGFPTYAAQLTTYMQGTQKPAVYAVVCRDTDELEVLTYDEPPLDFSEIVNKVLSVEALHSHGILPPCTGAQYTCAYDYLCDRRELSPADIALIGDDGDAVLADAVARYEEVREWENEIKLLKAAVRDDILTAMSGRQKADIGLTRVQHIEGTRKKLNTKKLRDRLGEELDEFYDETSYTQLRVSKRKEETDD